MVDNTGIPPRLGSIIEDFQLCEGQEKLELLLEYSEKMPPLPDHLRLHPDQMEQVPECMTPVHIHAELQEGGLHFYFDIPPTSPTVRGYAALLGEGLDGATPEQVMKIPESFYQQLGLEQVLSHQRLNGISALLAHMKQLALKKVAE